MRSAGLDCRRMPDATDQKPAPRRRSPQRRLLLGTLGVVVPAAGLPAQSEGNADLDQVPPDLDQTFSSVLQAEAELIQSAAALGVVHSYRQTPKQLLEEFEKLDPQGDIHRHSRGWLRRRRRSSRPRPSPRPPSAISLWPSSTFAIATASRRSTAPSRAEISIRATMFRSARA